jgi:hypothetical protein
MGYKSVFNGGGFKEMADAGLTPNRHGCEVVQLSDHADMEVCLGKAAVTLERSENRRWCATVLPQLWHGAYPRMIGSS